MLEVELVGQARALELALAGQAGVMELELAEMAKEKNRTFHKILDSWSRGHQGGRTTHSSCLPSGCKADSSNHPCMLNRPGTQVKGTALVRASVSAI